MYACHKCRYTTKYVQNIERHRKRTTSCVDDLRTELKNHDLPYECRRCGMGYAREHCKDKHELVCGGIHPLQCPTCKVCFKTKFAKSRHVAQNKCLLHDLSTETDVKDTDAQDMLPASATDEDDASTSQAPAASPTKKTEPKKEKPDRKTPSGKKAGQCQDCDKWATYNFPGEKRAFCVDCRLPGMIDVRTKRCETCNTGATFVDKTDGHIRYSCAAHKTPGSVVISLKKTCAHPGCYRQPTYALFCGTPSVVCKEHKLEGMVTKRKDCVQTDCDKVATFGFPGSACSRCLDHAKPGQIKQPQKRCTRSNTCTSLATHGHPPMDRVSCEIHADSDMVDLVNQECKSCSRKSRISTRLNALLRPHQTSKRPRRTIRTRAHT